MQWTASNSPQHALRHTTADISFDTLADTLQVLSWRRYSAANLLEQTDQNLLELGEVWVPRI